MALCSSSCHQTGFVSVKVDGVYVVFDYVKKKLPNIWKQGKRMTACPFNVGLKLYLRSFI